MIFGAIIEFAVGAACIILGLLIWKKQKINVIHEYHYQNVKAEDIPAYTRLMGIGQLIIGIGISVTGVLNLFELAQWWMPLTAGFIAGLAVINRAQLKYNGSWFS